MKNLRSLATAASLLSGAFFPTLGAGRLVLALASDDTQEDRRKRNLRAGGRIKRLTQSQRGTRKSAEHYRKHDPFYGIASNGQRGAAARMRAQADGFAKTAVAKRNSRTPDFSNPFAKEARREAFKAEIIAVGALMLNPDAARRQAIKNVRRLAA